jgi:hypothetical protein
MQASVLLLWQKLIIMLATDCDQADGSVEKCAIEWSRRTSKSMTYVNEQQTDLREQETDLCERAGD